MTVRVVNVRTHRGPVIYVGRACHGWPGHRLANPYRVANDASPAKRAEVLAQYVAWLDALPDRDTLLRWLAADVRRSGLPLACWCVSGEWTAGAGPRPDCHAAVLAERVQAILEKEQ